MHSPSPLLAGLLLALCACFAGLVLTAPAHAYDLSRQSPSYYDDGIERGFATFQLGFWIPGGEAFSNNHNLSLQLGGEVGVKVFSASDHHFYLIGGATVSPQTLPRYLRQRDDEVILAFIGFRWIPGPICTESGNGCLFVELALGAAWETVEPEPDHDAPQGEFAFTAGIGYRWRIGRHLTIGARFDFAYLEEDYVDEIGWVSPTGFIGASF